MKWSSFVFFRDTRIFFKKKGHALIDCAIFVLLERCMLVLWPGNIHLALSFASRSLATSINPEFVYVERPTKKRIRALLYKSLYTHYCEMPRQILMNSLAVATVTPDEFAVRLMKGPRYLAITAGEVISITICTLVEVIFKNPDRCYDHLPVRRKNETRFLILHIL